MKCPICGATARFLMKKNGYDERICPGCGLSFVWPQPEMSFLAEEVYSVKSGYQSHKARDLSRVIPNRKQKRLLAYLAGRKTKGKLLDIGCSSGEFMFFAKGIGYAVYGVELNPRTAAIAVANGLYVHRGTLGTAPFKAGEFDVIHMGDLIEHVHDPKRLVAQAHELLRPGGEVVVATPNMDCFWSRMTLALYRIFRVPWPAATPPYHLFQFADSNLRMLLESSGFRMARVWYLKMPSLAYELGAMHLKKQWKKDKTGSSFLRMAFGYAVTSAAFGLNRLIELFPVKRFDMAMIAERI